MHLRQAEQEKDVLHATLRKPNAYRNTIVKIVLNVQHANIVCNECYKHFTNPFESFEIEDSDEFLCYKKNVCVFFLS